MPAKKILNLKEYKLIRKLAARPARHRTIPSALGVSMATWLAIRRRDDLAFVCFRDGRRQAYRNRL